MLAHSEHHAGAGLRLTPINTGGTYNYSLEDLTPAFVRPECFCLPPSGPALTYRARRSQELLPGKRYVFGPSRQPSTKEPWLCSDQFFKWQKCLALIEETEAQEGFKYDFVMRQRPDMLVAEPMPSVFSLKRAVYVETLRHGCVRCSVLWSHPQPPQPPRLTCLHPHPHPRTIARILDMYCARARWEVYNGGLAC